MALQSSGQITFGNISNEFGLPPGNNLGGYRVSENHGSLSNLPLDNTIPQSGEIRFSDFYSRRLNVVVDCYSGGTETRANARSKYNGNQVNVIGGFRGKPSNPSGIKVIVNVNKSFQSQKDNNQNVVALRTGEYGSNCLLRVDVGGSGYIGGAGGNGGNGNSGDGSPGQNGNSGLGIDHESSDGTTVINNSGTISAGFGGGGGGGGAYDYDKGSSRSAGGGGGGGGAGFPAGSGGSATGSGGGGGGNGGLNSGGAGGPGRNNDGEAVAGAGGNGGSNAGGPGAGGEGNGGEGSESEGGSAGGNGAAIRRESGGITISVVNNGTIRGSTSATGVA